MLVDPRLIAMFDKGLIYGRVKHIRFMSKMDVKSINDKIRGRNDRNRQ